MDVESSDWKDYRDGVKILRLYEAKLTPEWPKIVIMELTAEKFREFEEDTLQFDKKYQPVTESRISWISTCAKPPQVKEIPSRHILRWLVVLFKGGATRACCAAYPVQESEDSPQ
jgi:hypothetical protein